MMSKLINSFLIFTLTTIPQITEAQSLVSLNQTKQLTEQSKLAINGIGPIRVGMTIKQASQSSGLKLIQVSSGGEDYGCFYFKPQNNPKGVSFMVTDERISRVDIDNPRITTISGAKIGDSEKRIKSLYAGQIQVTPHEYIINGHYLTYVPRDSKDRNYRVVFESNGSIITEIRAGKLPEVLYVEGCV